MAAQFKLEMQVPFHDLDPMQVVWHGNYFKYFDRTRFGLFEDVGIDLYGYMTTHNYLFPIIRSSIKHIAPLRFNDRFFCLATVSDARYKIALDFEIRLKETGKICARGKSEQAAVTLPDMELAFEIPEEIQKALGF